MPPTEPPPSAEPPPLNPSGQRPTTSSSRAPLFTTPLPPPPPPPPLDLPSEGSGSGSLSDEPEPDGSPTAETSPTVSLPDRRRLATLIRGAVKVAGVQANRFLARDHVERQQGLWLTDPEDEREIAEPIAAIAARRPGIQTSPDLADAIAAAIALVGYALKQLQLRSEIRAARASGLIDEETGLARPADQVA